MEFGYWGIKGLGETSRMVAAYTKTKLNEYNPTSREEWAEKKAAFGAPFANLPYLIDGDFKLTESSAIPVYIAHKAGRTDLLGNDIKEQAQVRQIEGVLGDLRTAVFKVMWAKEGHKEALTEALKEGNSFSNLTAGLSKFLGEKDYFLGHVTLVDFYFAYSARIFHALAKAFDVELPFHKHANLVALVKRVESLEGVKEFVDARVGVPFMPPPMLAYKLPTVAEF